ncbi:MAG: Xaa-Pro aminopeptidase [Gammaproteobacteria bacterium]|nr:MAG: Xaa-Pro aminopeptidase [Gammaproteobacteria bacterium]
MNQAEFARRRKQLMEQMGRGAIAILPAAPLRLRNRDTEYPYRPDSDFYYLTGFPEPEAVAVLIPGHAHGEYILFSRERDPEKEVWNGARAGQEGACRDYGADDAFPIDDLDDILPGLLEKCERVYCVMGAQPEFDQHLIGWVNQIRARSRAGLRAPEEFIALDQVLHEMRLFKSRAEIALMKKAARISAGAHKRAMRACKPGMMEYQIEAELRHEFMRQGSQAPAYNSIVAGGANACVLHYTGNRAPLKDGDLLLIDAGAELDNYASDITRTFPVNGRFSAGQRAVYEIVLEAQYAALAKVKPGNHWNDPHQAAVRVLTKGLIELGLLKGALPKLIKEQAYRRFYMHRTGHWLGMDVHDVGDYKIGDAWRVLEPGMVLTVEPGLYIAPGTSGAPKKWWGIGVRIEDDVHVTPRGHEILSADAPKTVAEIESLMAH